MELNPLHLLLLTAAMSGSRAADKDIFTDDRYHIVRAKVLENILTPDGLSGQAILRIDEVLEGEPILLERTVKVINSDKSILGSMIAPVIYPLMNKNEEWLLVVGSKKDKNELWLGQARVPGVAHLPLLKGRDSSYEPVQEMLRNRRDHPEKYSVTEPASAKAQEVKATPPHPVPDVLVVQPSTDKPPEGVQLSTKVDRQESAEDGRAWWGILGALGVLGALVVGWLWRHPCKRGGT